MSCKKTFALQKQVLKQQQHFATFTALFWAVTHGQSEEMW